MLLDILKCILCCEDEPHERYADNDGENSYTSLLLDSGSRIYDTFIRRSSTPSHNQTICQSDSDSYVQNREVIGLGTSTSNPASTRSTYLNTTARIYVVSTDSKNSSAVLPPFTYKPAQSSPRPPPSSISQSLFSTVSSTESPASLRPSRLPAKSPVSSAKSSPSFPTLPFSEPSPSSSKPSSSFGTPPPSSPKPPPSFKWTLFSASSNLIDKKKKKEYTWLEKDPLPIYVIPQDIKDFIDEDKVPGILYTSLSPSTYKDYFAALLYAEDHYLEKWSNFQLVNVTLDSHEAVIYKTLGEKAYLYRTDEQDDKKFAAFGIESVPEKRPFLLSRDFVFAQPSGVKVKPFQGFIYKVVKSKVVLVEFQEDFYSQHHPNRKYDISFSFNRVCLKRAHHAVATASAPLFKKFLFPNCASRKSIPATAFLPYSNNKLGSDQNSAIRRILSFQGSPPYLVQGPLSVTGNQLSKTGMVIREAVLQIYRSSPKTQILICAPLNRTCDVLMGSLKKEIPESGMFRANAAFRERDGVPDDILSLSLYRGECFTCPSVEKLRQFRVIFSTFVSSFRLHNEGIETGHFTHIFLVDASSATEPETLIALSNLANKKTSLIITGASKDCSSWVRSDIARKKGLRKSYFERLCENKTYKSLEPMFITQLN